MQLNKKGVCFLLLLILSIFVLAACGGSDNDLDLDNDSEGKDTGLPEEGETVTVVGDQGETYEGPIVLVNTFADIPECNDQTKDVIYLVLDDEGFQYCDGNTTYSVTAPDLEEPATDEQEEEEGGGKKDKDNPGKKDEHANN